ncbi:hypothetical protein C0993_009404 [Termitomyces sp. T159_Od127]|nr:hypothetical protein C0993_009404 [Termitomyces sp. T159_Od127]
MLHTRSFAATFLGASKLSSRLSTTLVLYNEASKLSMKHLLPGIMQFFEGRLDPLGLWPSVERRPSNPSRCSLWRLKIAKHLTVKVVSLFHEALKGQGLSTLRLLGINHPFLTMDPSTSLSFNAFILVSIRDGEGSSTLCSGLALLKNSHAAERAIDIDVKAIIREVETREAANEVFVTAYMQREVVRVE